MFYKSANIIIIIIICRSHAYKKTNVYGQSRMLNKWTTISHAGTRDAHALDYVVLLSFQVFIFRQYVSM